MKIGFIGNGWRTQGYWRIVRQVPEKFEISGALFRDAKKAAQFNTTHPGLGYTELEAFLRQPHDMVFILLPAQVLRPYAEAVLQAGFPLLIETPPTWDPEKLTELWELQKKYHASIQVAEQYFLQPYHQTVRKLVDSGALGDVSNLRISMAHDYHGISLMRRLLGEGAGNGTITAQQFTFPVLYHCGRNGMEEGMIHQDSRKIASFSFEDGKAGFFDFAGEQYFNYFRSRHLNVQGSHGEINDYEVCYWNGVMPVHTKLERQDTGKDSNLEGYFHRGFTWNGKMIYQSPFAGYTEARLTDDEIGMGSILLGMERMIQTGEEIYPLSEALTDTYLFLKMNEAIQTGRPVKTEKQVWENLHS